MTLRLPEHQMSFFREEMWRLHLMFESPQITIDNGGVVSQVFVWTNSAAKALYDLYGQQLDRLYSLEQAEMTRRRKKSLQIREWKEQRAR